MIVITLLNDHNPVKECTYENDEIVDAIDEYNALCAYADARGDAYWVDIVIEEE